MVVVVRPCSNILGDSEMMVPESGNLRQMGDADDLMMFGEIQKFFSDNLRHPSADAGVHFIKNDGFHSVCV